MRRFHPRQNSNATTLKSPHASGMGYRKFSLVWLQRAIAIVLVLGLVCRVALLDRQVYWYDETMTSLRMSGYTQAQFQAEAFTGEVRTVGELRDRYQYPNETRDLNDVMTALSRHPEHSPLYYLMARVWTQTLGNSVALVRSLSVILGLLVLPLTYWLYRELFENRVVAWIGVALTSISPFHVLYAREAREYSLWTVTILLSSAVLLWALRTGDRRNSGAFWGRWGLYGITVALNLYAHPFAAFVNVSHALYVVGRSGLAQLRDTLAYLVSSALGLLLFSPWLYIVWQNRQYFVQNTQSTANPRDGMVWIWLRNLTRIFFDVNQGTSPINLQSYLVLLLILLAVWVLCRETRPQTWGFVLLLMGVTGLALWLPDLILGGRRTNNLRYFVPCVLGIQMAVSYLFAMNISTLWLGVRPHRRWKYGLFALFFLGSLSCLISIWHPVWWHKSYAKSRHNPAIARIIANADRPSIVTDEIPGRILPLLHALPETVRVQLVQRSQVPELPDATQGQVFLFRPSPQLQAEVSQRYNVTLEKAYDGGLWTLPGRG